MANEQGGGISRGLGVSPGVARMQRGARQRERGRAAIVSSGMSPTMQAAYMQSANEMGDIAANELSDQFWQKQFENVIKFEIQGEIDNVKAAFAAHEEALQITVMPVGRTVEYGEGQQIADETAPEPDNVQMVPTASQGPEGQQGQEAIPQRVHSKNPAADNAGEMGATSYSDTLALLDPALGNKPVPLSSGRGMAITQQEDNKFLQVQTNAYQRILDIAGKYPFNPYSNKFVERTYKLIEKMANKGLSGSEDTQKTQEWREGRMQFEAEQEARQQGVDASQVEVDKDAARLRAQVGLGQNMLNSNTPGIESAFGETIVNKMRNGVDLTANEQRQVSAGIAGVQKIAAHQLTMDAATRQYRTPIKFSQTGGDLQGTPTEWALHDDGYQMMYNRALAVQGVEIQKQFANDPMETQVARLQDANRNITKVEMDRYERGGGAGEQIKLAFELIAAQDSGSVQKANDTATLLRAPELAKHDDTLSASYDAVLDQIIAPMAEKGYTEKEIAYARARRWRTIYESPDMNGRDMPEGVYDQDTKNRMDAWADEWGWKGDVYPKMGKPGFMGDSIRASAPGQHPPRPSVAVPGTDKPAAEAPAQPLTKAPKSQTTIEIGRRLHDIKGEYKKLIRQRKSLEHHEGIAAQSYAMRNSLSGGVSEALEILRKERPIELQAKFAQLEGQEELLAIEEKKLLASQEEAVAVETEQELTQEIEKLLKKTIGFTVTRAMLIREFEGRFDKKTIRAVAAAMGIE